MVVAATGGSTNGALHLPAIAHEAGIKFDLFDVARIFKKTPYIADLMPGGKYTAADMHQAGGVPVVIKELLDAGLMHGDCLTVTGKTIAENHRNVRFPEGQDLFYRVKKPLSKTGGVVGLKGNLASEGAIVKVAGMKTLAFRGPARCFDCEEDAFDAVVKKKIKKGDVIVIRYEGPRGGPGMREMLSTTAALYGEGMGENRGADHRWALLRRHARILHRPCRAGGGGGRTDRAAQGRRHDRDRRQQGHPRGGADRPRARGAAQEMEAAAPRLPIGRAVALCPDGGIGARRRGVPPGRRR